MILRKSTETINGHNCRKCGGTLRYAKNGKCIKCQIVSSGTYRTSIARTFTEENFIEKMNGVFYGGNNEISQNDG